MSRQSVAAALTVAALGYHTVPSVTVSRRFRNAVLPKLAGAGRPGHVALTFDDGPDPSSTPAVLDTLDRLDVRATFFVLGRSLAVHPDLGRRIVDDGHEIAVHGWRHRPLLLTSPWELAMDMRSAVDTIDSVTGAYPRFWRPPHGIWTGPALTVARRLDLEPVLWTTWGRDWTRSLAPRDIVSTVDRTDRRGATVLLHDANPKSASTAWRATVAALPTLVAGWRAQGRDIGPLRDHRGPDPGSGPDPGTDPDVDPDVGPTVVGSAPGRTRLASRRSAWS